MKSCTLILALVVSFPLWGKTINIYPGPGTPLTSAVAQANPGDSLLIHAGTYREGQLFIKKSIALIGIGLPVLDGERKYEIMTVSADGVIIEGIHFNHSGRSGYNDIAALRLMQCGHTLVRNNIFDDSFFGIFCQHAFYTTIANNRFHSDAKDEINSANGIHCWKSDHMLIVNNDITGHRDGIYFEFVTLSEIIGNTSHQNARYGLHFMFSQENTFYHNRFIDNGAGIAVMYSHGVIIRDNQFSDNWGGATYGILMKDISDSHVEGNSFMRNTISIHMEGCNRINLNRNIFEGNGWAIKIQASCTGNEITGNNFIRNSFDIATNGTLSENHFAGNYWDKYEGYDLNHDGTGDIPYRPVSMYSMIVERNPASLMLLRSFMSGLMDKAEKVIPSLTPEQLKDESPSIRALPLKSLP